MDEVLCCGMEYGKILRCVVVFISEAGARNGIVKRKNLLYPFRKEHLVGRQSIYVTFMQRDGDDALVCSWMFNGAEK